MYINLILAIALVAITTYTDVKERKIYNKHVYPAMGLALIFILLQEQYQLLLSAAIVCVFFCFLYYGSNFISKIAIMTGALPLAPGEKAIGGGDVKLPVALSLLVGHMPVLYGTAMAGIIMIGYYGIRTWQACGTIKAFADVALGRVHMPTAFAPFLGPSIAAIAIIENFLA